MKKPAFSRRTYRILTGAAVSAAFFVPLGLFAAPALVSSASAAPSSAQYQYKVTLCHHTHSKKHPWQQIRVGQPAVAAHLRHGDTLGPCPPPAPKQHGNGNGNSNNGNSNNGNANANAHGNNAGGNGNGKGHH